ncbi:MAG: hydroxymyristoyl-ACP dehydratase [Burkholderiales bacterium]|nr:hydroxymyristoyl-ACP dehydratase [Burkholderiales bacterium]
MSRSPATLDHGGIAQRIPHAGAMCLLDSLLDWSDDRIRCRIVNHADPAHPLRSASGLLSPCAIEYAAQAMALHGALCATADAAPPTPGFLASARAVGLHVARLDDRPGPLTVTASRLAAGQDQALYRFELHDARGVLLVDGRAAVVLNTPLAAPA